MKRGPPILGASLCPEPFHGAELAKSSYLT